METIPEKEVEDTNQNIIMVDNYSEKSMINIIQTNLTDKGYNLSQDQVIWIKKFININPTFFSDIHSDMISLIDDKRIDLHEIPLLIKIFVKIFHEQDIKQIKNPKDITAFIKFCFKIFIDYNFLIVSNVEKNVIENIIDNSLDLLALNIIPIEEEVEECCVCFSSLFGK